MIHNVEDKKLIKIQDTCHVLEQSLRKGYVKDALMFCDVIIELIATVKKEIENE